MAFPNIIKHKLLGFALLVIIFCSYSGCKAEDNPAELSQKALFCFNSKFIYAGCDEAYRLNEGGNLHVPPQAIDSFCNGPCLTETELVLNCVDNIFSNFLFYNKATIQDIRGAINVGCTYNKQGIFNFGGYPQGEISNVEKLKTSTVIYTLLLITGSFYFILF
ncbi:hypothetical protein TorRG33x02_146370 [Trema orientale]|uniref:DUF7731 domain-containing protein n=1 Tax=Trema orientale TaxID=63057 RepID=A0A2P5EVD0_TREOI|nr:hypothetical protein TorRG33x02_146370 [Trema orientale]